MHPLRTRASRAIVASVLVIACIGGLFSQAKAAQPIVNLFGSAVPANPADQDSKAVELGMRFRSDVAGQVVGVRFYKGTGNTGKHVGNLWTTSGTRLATVNFTNESTTGWQSANFSNPVSIQANTNYIVSYYSPRGHYAGDIGYFNTSKYTPPLRAPVNTASAPNGVYAYGSSSRYPSLTYQSTNYYVDIRFQANDPVTTTSTSTTTVPTTSSSTTTTAPTTTTTAPTTTTTAPSSGWPGTSNTGVPAGVTLTPYTGPTLITTPGTVIDGKLITSSLTIWANDVIVRNSKFVEAGIDNRKRCAGPLYDCDLRGGFRLTIQDSEFDGRGNGTGAMIGLSDITIRRVNVHDFESGIRLEDDALVEDSWIHGDTACDAGDHLTAIGDNGGANITIRHNSLYVSSSCASAALSFYGDFGQIDNILVENNLFNGGAYATWAGAYEPGKPYPNGTNVRYLNNHFGRQVNAKCGYFGPVAGWGSGPGNVWSGNVWDDAPWQAGDPAAGSPVSP